jgi:hypothetical protein
MGRLNLFDELLHVLMRAADEAQRRTSVLSLGGEGDGDGVDVDIQAEVDHNFHVSAFLSGLSLTTNHCGLALRLTPARNPRSREADTLAFNIASHSD